MSKLPNKTTDNVTILAFTGLGNLVLATPFLKEFKSSDKLTILYKNPVVKEYLTLHFPAANFVRMSRSQSLAKNLIQIVNFFYFLGRNQSLVIDLDLSNSFKNFLKVARIGKSFISFFEIGQKKVGCKVGGLVARHFISEKEAYAYARELFFPRVLNECRVEEMKSSHNSHIQIGIHLGSGGKLKRLPIAKHSQAIRLLFYKFNANFILFGGEEEKDLEAQLMEALDNRIDKKVVKRIVSHIGSLTLQEVEEKIRTCDIFLSNDSGLMHLSSMLGVPTIGVFGPSSVTKNQTMNISQQDVLLHNGPCDLSLNSICKQCSKENVHPHCLAEFPIELLLLEVDKILCR